MVSLMVEISCPDSSIERYKVKIIKKYNIRQGQILPKFRSRPAHELSGIVIGKNISYETAKEYLEQYLNQSQQMGERTRVLMSVRLLK
jgi:hypothetical protein